MNKQAAQEALIIQYTQQKIRDLTVDNEMLLQRLKNQEFLIQGLKQINERLMESLKHYQQKESVCSRQQDQSPEQQQLPAVE